MFWDRPADIPPTEAEADLAARLVPDPAALQRAIAALTARNTPDTLAVIPLALPGKTRGIWTTGQVVVTVPALWLTPGRDMRDATDAADRAARGWMTYRDQTGTTAYALVHRDGTCAVFEGWR